MDSLVGVNCFQGFTAELEVCYKNNSNKINKLGLWGIYKESWVICRVNPENQGVASTLGVVGGSRLARSGREIG